MPTITIEVPDETLAALRKDPEEFAREMRIAATVEWYAEGIVSQGKAAELAGLTRAEFLDELHRRRIPACQATVNEIRDEIHGV